MKNKLLIPLKNEVLKGRLPEILRTFTTGELRRFGEFLNSPIFNKNNRLIKLFSLIKQGRPTFEEISKQKLYKEVFPERKNYKDSDLRALISDLVKQARKFLIFLESEESEMDQQYYLLEALMKRNLNLMFQQSLETAHKYQNAQQKRGIGYYYQQYRLDEISFRYTTVVDNRKVKATLQSAAEHLDKYYLANKLSYSVYMISRQKVLNVPHESWYLDELMAFVDGHPFEDIPAIHLKYLLVRALRDLKNHSYYNELKTYLIANASSFPDYELKQIYQLIINYGMWRVNDGEKQYAQENFEWYKQMLEKGMLFVGKGRLTKTISPHHYKNLVKIALDIKEYNWAYQFIYDYKKLVAAKHRENVFNYNIAHYYFARKEFTKAWDYLRILNFSDSIFIDFYYHIYFKTLQIQTTFELEETEQLIASLHSFESYLRRNRSIGNNFQTAYLNFVHIVRKLHNKQLGKRIRTDLIKEIQERKPLVETNWLLEKAKTKE